MARRPLIALAALVAGLIAPMALVAPAQAAARVTIANDNGDAVADPTYATTVKLKGRGFQSIRGGFGGIYVFFGTVKPGWQPSKGGQTGHDYYYVPDSESKDNQGFQKFVAFPGSDTADAANGGLIKADGTWSTTLVVPGATFQAVDRSGKAVAIDCRKVTCGVITIGAHGVANARNESFTPIRFKSLHGASPTSDPSGSPSSAPTAGATTGAGGGTPAPSANAIQPPAPAASAGPPAVTVDRATAVVGRVLSFTASGFRPGEQVVATFDDGLAAVGPLSAGASGEIAGVLRLPLDTTAGTHVLRLTGAASGATPSANFAVTSAPAPTVTQADGRSWAPYAFLAASLVVLGAAVGMALLRLRRRRRGARPSVSEASHAV